MEMYIKIPIEISMNTASIIFPKPQEFLQSKTKFQHYIEKYPPCLVMALARAKDLVDGAMEACHSSCKLGEFKS